MRVYIIHNPHRLDRARCIADLFDLHPGMKLQPSITLPWETDKHDAAIRGCSLAHLEALTAGPPDDILILEDDAIPIKDGLALWDMVKDHIPRNAGVVVLGGETEAVSGSNEWGFRKVLPPLWGSHAILYRKNLLESSFITNAYKILATQKVGKAVPGASVGLCYESVIIQAVARAGLDIIRPSHMVYATKESTSDRSGELMEGRVRWMNLPLERPVAPSLCLKLPNESWAVLHARVASTSLKALMDSSENPHASLGWGVIPGVQEKMPPAGSKVFTVVRDPVERFKSVVKWFHDKEHPHFPKMGLDVDKWLDRIAFEHRSCPPELQDEHLRRQSDHPALSVVNDWVMMEDLDVYAMKEGLSLNRKQGSADSVEIYPRPDQLARIKDLYAGDYEMLSIHQQQLTKHHASS